MRPFALKLKEKQQKSIQLHPKYYWRHFAVKVSQLHCYLHVCKAFLGNSVVSAQNFLVSRQQTVSLSFFSKIRGISKRTSVSASVTCKQRMGLLRHGERCLKRFEHILVGSPIRTKHLTQWKGSQSSSRVIQQEELNWLRNAGSCKPHTSYRRQWFF